MAFPESSPLRAKSPDCLSSAMQTQRRPFPCLGLSFHVCRMDSLLSGPGVSTCLVWGAQQASRRGSLRPGTRGTITHECSGHETRRARAWLLERRPLSKPAALLRTGSASQALLRAGKRPELSASLSRGESLVLPHLTGPPSAPRGSRGLETSPAGCLPPSPSHASFPQLCCAPHSPWASVNADSRDISEGGLLGGRTDGRGGCSRPPVRLLPGCSPALIYRVLAMPPAALFPEG